jgi:hypothetical protein
VVVDIKQVMPVVQAHQDKVLLEELVQLVLEQQQVLVVEAALDKVLEQIVTMVVDQAVAALDSTVKAQVATVADCLTVLVLVAEEALEALKVTMKIMPMAAC